VQSVVAFTREIPFDFWFMARSWMFGVGFPLIFVSITTASCYGIPRQGRSGLGPDQRGAQYRRPDRRLSDLQCAVAPRTVLPDRLVDEALSSSVQYQDTLHQITAFFVGQGSPLIEAQQQTIAWAGQQVHLQASFPAYMEAMRTLIVGEGAIGYFSGPVLLSRAPEP
jgi:MFS transporter, DHA2 family, multidrug resistance protein